VATSAYNGHFSLKHFPSPYLKSAFITPLGQLIAVSPQ